jgi:O-antigen ligase/polysaccharide polymerase Wzy-like membrane protein
MPDPTPALFLLALASAWAWLIADEVWLGMLIPGVIVGLVMVYWLAIRPDVAVLALIAASAMPRLAVSISNLNARPEHIVGGLVLLAVPIWLRRRWPHPQWMFADYAVLVWIGMNFFSSLFISIAPGQTIKWAFQQALVVVPYFVLRVFATDAQRFRRLVHILLAVGVLEGAYGIVGFYSSLLFGTEFGVSPGQYEEVTAATSTQFEPNLLGSYCGACCVMLLTLYFLKRDRKYLLGYAVALTAMGVSFSRAALLATGAALTILLFWLLWKKLLERPLLLRAGVATVIVAAALMPALLAPYLARFSTIDVAEPMEDPNTMNRTIQAVTAWDDIVVHPWVGNGTASAQLLFTWEELGMGEGAGWISNTPERVLHDTGLFGLAAFVLFLASLARRSWRILKQEVHPELLALVFAAVVYSITFQATEGTLLAFTWVHLGLIACAVSLYQDSRRNAEA